MRVAIFLLFFICALCNSLNVLSKTVVVEPKDGIETLNRALKEASPNDTFLLKKGVFIGKIEFDKINGLPEFPIVIMGENEDECFINGNSLPGVKLKKFGCQIDNSSWIVIQNLNFYNCWTDIIKVNNSNYISIKNCSAKGGKRFLYTEGFSSHHFLIENCHWEQDEKVWTHADDYSWDEIHHGKYSYYNGSIFQSARSGGVFVLRNNTIRNTFNAFRLSQVLNNEFDYLSASNGEIYNNVIINTSDNVLEPENYCSNLHFYHNQLINGHAFISITEVGGGPIYIYGNTGLSEENCEDGWTIFKLSNDERSLEKPLYIFNNSWDVDYDIFGSINNIWKNNHIKHFNNAYFIRNQKHFGIYNIGENNEYDFDCSNLKFPAIIDSSNYEQNGIIADPQFRNSLAGDFRLKRNSPCINTGNNPVEFEITINDELPDIGCFQGETKIEGPPFRFEQPAIKPEYIEKPRIVRHKTESSSLTIWFSAPIKTNKNFENEVQLIQSNKALIISKIELSGDGYILKIYSTDKIEKNKIALAFKDFPKGKNGEIGTSWASTIKITTAL